MNKENILVELLEERTLLIKEMISGNQANMNMMKEYCQPQIDKIDELILKLTNVK